MADDWRVRIALGDLPPSPHSFRQALIPALRSRLGYQAGQVAVRSNAVHIFLYAPSMGLADKAAQLAREVLDAPVRTEGWDRRKHKWRDADAILADLTAAGQRAYRREQERKEHVSRQEYERTIAARFGLRRWQVRVELPSHRDVIALAGHLAAPGMAGPAAHQVPRRLGGL